VTVPGAKDNTPKILAGVVAVLAGALIVVPILAPQSSVPEASEPVPGSVLADPFVTPSPSSASADDGYSPLTSSASGVPDLTDADPRELLLSALAKYEEQMELTGGVSGSFISADSQDMLFTLRSNGDYRAVTSNANAPEWLYVNPVLYARLGDAELKAQRDALVAIDKPDAIWTDAAMNSDRQGMFLSAGNIANAVADLAPLMTDTKGLIGKEGTTIIQGIIDLTQDLGLNAEAYNLRKVDPSSEASSLRQATVVFTIDVTGVLQGYIVQPPGSAQPVSLILTKFTKPSVKRPAADRVITLEDLAPIMEDRPAESLSPSPAQ
jgi:hypothetical protein